MKDTIHNIIIALIYLWIGFVCAISFMEAWLKFTAQGVTRPIGLSIGSVVFSGLTKVETVLALLIVLLTGLLRIKQARITHLKLLVLPMLLLLVQTLYLLPALDERVEKIIMNESVQDSPLHTFYVIFEIIKVGLLFWVGNKALKIKFISL